MVLPGAGAAPGGAPAGGAPAGAPPATSDHRSVAGSQAPSLPRRQTSGRPSASTVVANPSSPLHGGGTSAMRRHRSVTGS